MLNKLIHGLPPEHAHRLGVWALAHGLIPSQPEAGDPRLHVQLAGLALPHPVGLAAGFDKNAETLVHVFKQGFGFAEVGTITPKAQPGNPQPRVFRVPKHEAVINRLGFNNDGLAAAIERLKAPQHGIVGANIGKNKDSTDAIADYVTGLQAVYPYVDYVTVNISSPNTAGLRDLQHGDALHTLLEALLKARAAMEGHKPLFVKIAPDLDEVQLQAIAELALGLKLDGLIVSNTTIARPDELAARWHEEAGGLSGRPLFVRSTDILRQIYALTEGQIPLIGVGGIACADDAYTKIRAGASAIQLYTALVYQGFGLITRIKRGLTELLERDGFASVADAVGADVSLAKS